MQTYNSQIAQEILSNNKPVEIIELGGGDGSKAIQLLQSFKGEIDKVIYKSVDISGSALRHLSKKISEVFPALEIIPLEADFFAQNWIEANSSDTTRLFLFLGSTICNFNEGVWQDLLVNITSQMQPTDYLLIGFDLVKDPMVIEAAFADSQGVTKAFNLNLLKRINQELGGNFNLSRFEHHSFYNPQLQRAESYLLSIENQQATISGANFSVDFHAWEAIHTEISRKFTLLEIQLSANLNNCTIIQSSTDSQSWFMDSLWRNG